jgi:hypothetical protein
LQKRNFAKICQKLRLGAVVPVIRTIQELGIGRIADQSQSGQKVRKTLISSRKLGTLGRH